MDTQQAKSEIERVTRETVAKFLKDLPNHLTTKMQGAVAKILGFRTDSWGGKWEIDTCNGRKSLVGDYISAAVKETIRDTVKDVITEKAVEATIETARQAVLDNFEREFFYEYKRAVSEVLHRKIQEMAERQVDRMLEEMGKITTDLEIADPQCGEDPLEAELLKRAVEKA